jgi:hypothetical protein
VGSNNYVEEWVLINVEVYFYLSIVVQYHHCWTLVPIICCVCHPIPLDVCPCVLVPLEGETVHGFVDHCLVAIWAEFFLFPRGLMATVIVVATAAAAAVAASTAATTATAPPAAAATTTTLGECCHEFHVLSHYFRHLFALLCKFGLEESKGIEC